MFLFAVCCIAKCSKTGVKCWWPLKQIQKSRMLPAMIMLHVSEQTSHTGFRKWPWPSVTSPVPRCESRWRPLRRGRTGDRLQDDNSAEKMWCGRVHMQQNLRATIPTSRGWTKSREGNYQVSVVFLITCSMGVHVIIKKSFVWTHLSSLSGGLGSPTCPLTCRVNH